MMSAMLDRRSLSAAFCFALAVARCGRDSPPSTTPSAPDVIGGEASDADAVIASSASRGRTTGNAVGIPAVAIRGGGVQAGTGAGIFALYLHVAPTYPLDATTSRCVIAR